MTSKTTVLAVVVSLALFAIGALAGTIYLIDSGASEGAVAIVVGPMGVALGALASVLNSTRSTLGANDVEPTVVAGMQTIGGAQDVTVVNPPSDPVPTTTARTPAK